MFSPKEKQWHKRKWPPGEVWIGYSIGSFNGWAVRHWNRLPRDSGGVTNLVDVALGTWFSGGLGRVYIWTQRS